MYKKLPVGSMDLSGLWKRNSNGIPSWTNRLEWPVGIQWSNGEARLPRIWSNALDMFGWFDWWIWLMSGYVCFFFTLPHFGAMMMNIDEWLRQKSGKSQFSRWLVAPEKEIVCENLLLEQMPAKRNVDHPEFFWFWIEMTFQFHGWSLFWGARF